MDIVNSVWADNRNMEISVKVFGNYYDSVSKMSKDLCLPYSRALNMIDPSEHVIEENIINYMIRYIEKHDSIISIKINRENYIMRLNGIYLFENVEFSIKDRDIIEIYRNIRKHLV